MIYLETNSVSGEENKHGIIGQWQNSTGAGHEEDLPSGLLPGAGQTPGESILDQVLTDPRQASVSPSISTSDSERDQPIPAGEAIHVPTPDPEGSSAAISTTPDQTDSQEQQLVTRLVTRLQHGIRRPKVYTDGTNCQVWSSSTNR